MTGSRSQKCADTSRKPTARLSVDTRGVSVQVGAVLLLGILVISVSLIQTSVIPIDNQQVEFRHSQDVRNDFVDLRNDVFRAGTTGTTVPTALSLGTGYPPRLVTINPPPARGELRTTDVTESASSIIIGNAAAVNNETRDYWNENKTFNTQSLVYTPTYNEYQNPPETRYENTVVSSEYDDASITATGQGLVNNRSITLVTLVGNLSASGADTRAVDLNSVSPSQTTVRTVALRNRTTGPMTLSVSTRLSKAKWDELLEAEQADGQVTAVRSGGPGRVNVSLASGVYDVRIVRVHVGEGSSSPPPRYLTTVDEPTSRSLLLGTTETITVEARDRFNNPVSGVTVTVTDPGLGQFVSPTQVVTDESGQAFFTYQAPKTATGTASFNATIGDGAARNVTYAFDVDAGGGGGRSLVWSTAFDWDPGDSALERGVVHEEYGDHQADRVDLGSGSEDNGLIAYWSLDEDSGATATDHTDNSYDVTADSGPVAFEDAGTLNTSAVSFDDGVLRDTDGERAVDELSGLTVSMWVNPTATTATSGTEPGLFSTEPAGEDGEDDGIALRYDESAYFAGENGVPRSDRTEVIKAAVRVDTGSGQVQTQLESSADAQSTGWQHLVFTWESGETITLYIDGRKDDPLYVGDDDGNEFGRSNPPPIGTTDARSSSPNSGLFIGTGTKGSSWDGRIDEVRIYESALSSSAVSELYNGTSPQGTPQAWQGSITTSYKLFETQITPDRLSLTGVGARVPAGTSMTVTVESDPDSDGTYEEESDPISVSSDVSQYDVSGLTQNSGRYRLHVVGTTTDIAKGPTLEEVRLTSQ